MTYALGIAEVYTSDVEVRKQKNHSTYTPFCQDRRENTFEHVKKSLFIRAERHFVLQITLVYLLTTTVKTT